MSRGDDVELSPEAQALVGQVRGLEARARRVTADLQADLAGIRRVAADDRADVDRERAVLAEEREALEALLESRVRGFEFIADAWADYELARAGETARALERKKHPARSAAKEVRAKGAELSEVRRELKRAQWVLALYEFHFPWLTDLRNLDEELSYTRAGELEGAADSDAGNEDAAREWLSAEEYAALPTAERNQRALDRYLRSRKSPWQLGRDYERYIGFLREQAGASVSYHGIFAGLADLGRDLICETPAGVEVVQCKRWAARKTIHERHVFQLFGTVVAMRIDRPDTTVTATFTTTTHLSDRARQFAKQLDIRVEEGVALDDYPRIKCNLARDGQRIYHLPFDQQYDTTLIEPDKGEQWVSTVAEAEALGFRRAARWKGADETLSS